MLSKQFRLLAAAFSFLLLITSCAPEEGDDDLIPSDSGEEFVGTWKSAETSQEFGSSNYEGEISKSSTANQILIHNFYNLGAGYTAKANISGNNLDIPNQVVNNKTFSGSGSIVNENRLNLNFTADDGGGVVDVVSVGMSR